MPNIESDPQALLQELDAMKNLYGQIDQLNLKNQQDEIIERNAPATPATQTVPSAPGE